MREPPRPPSLGFALACFGSALLFLLAGSAGLVWVAPDLAAGWFPLPRVVAVVHLFTLGWITLSMVAALHHFVPVALHVPLMGEAAGRVQLAAFDLGLAAFTIGEVLAAPALALAGAALLGLALLAFALSLGRAMLRPAPRGRTPAALLGAAAFLIVALSLGVMLAGDRALGWASASRLPVLSLHVQVALPGWVLLVLVAVGQRLLPMFLLARAPDPRLASASLLLVAGGALAPLLLIGRGGAAAWLPVAAVSLGLMLFLAQAAVAFRWGSGRKRLDPGLRLAGSALVFLALTLAIAPFATGDVWQRPQPLVLLVTTVVLGSVSLFVAGHYYRIVPFLVWSARWANLPPSPTAPRSPAGLYLQRAASASFLLLVAGAAVFVLAVGGGHAAGARTGAAIFAAGAAVLAWQMLRVMTSRPR